MCELHSAHFHKTTLPGRCCQAPGVKLLGPGDRGLLQLKRPSPPIVVILPGLSSFVKALLRIAQHFPGHTGATTRELLEWITAAA